MTTCLFPACSHEAQLRGLCKNHYTTASLLVKQRRTSWDKLVASGKAVESKKNNKHNKAKSWFLS